MKIEEIDKWLDNEYGCSYTRLEELHDFVVEQDLKHRDKAEKEIERLNNIINELEKYIDDYCWANYYEKVAGNRYIKSSILKDIREIIELKGDK